MFYFLNSVRVRLTLNVVVRGVNVYGFLSSMLLILSSFFLSASCMYELIVLLAGLFVFLLILAE